MSRVIGHFGARADGTFGAEIAAPGQSLAVPGARRLFTTDAQLVQIVYSDTVQFAYSQPERIVTNGPAGPVVTYVLGATATYVFPTPLPFRPEIYLTTFVTKNGESEYQLATAPGPRALSYESFNDRVTISYSEIFFDPITVDALSCRVTVLSIPWDKTASAPTTPAGSGTVPRMKIAENTFRISKEGFNVETATGIQLAFSETMEGLIPGGKGWITGFGDYPLPQAGSVPIIYVLGGSYINITVNAARSVFKVTGSSLPENLRYVIFNNRQF